MRLPLFCYATSNDPDRSPPSTLLSNVEVPQENPITAELSPHGVSGALMYTILHRAYHRGWLFHGCVKETERLVILINATQHSSAILNHPLGRSRSH